MRAAGARVDFQAGVSPGYFNTIEDIDVLLTALRNLDRSQLEGVADDILRGAC